ncbi:MAG: cytochrome c [Methylobacillus sp.]|jgi:cytochrome c55X|nr:cytochrome c [Methylobacillus sp.]
MDTFPVTRRPNAHAGRFSPAWARAVFFLFLMSAFSAWAEENISPERRNEIIRLVRNDCGACHGGTLKGGLGLPLRPENLRDKPPETLRATILHGRAETAMPPWSDFLNEEEAGWIVDQLLKGFPDAR